MSKRKGIIQFDLLLSVKNTLAMDLPISLCERGEANGAVCTSRGYVWEKHLFKTIVIKYSSTLSLHSTTASFSLVSDGKDFRVKEGAALKCLFMLSFLAILSGL